MSLKDRIKTLAKVGDRLRKKDNELNNIVERAVIHNRWFTPENVNSSISSIVHKYLSIDNLTDWVSKYVVPDQQVEKVLGIITAGNIPLVGIHDILVGYVCGYVLRIKPSSKDEVLTNFVVDLIKEHDHTSDIEIVSKFTKYDVIITTSSNSNATHFEYYFRSVPNVIRKNRNSLAILKGNESKDDILKLSDDIFSYFGLGCRNVASILVPVGFEFPNFMEVLHERRELILHNKYKNNFDYNFAIYSMNGDQFYSNGCVIVRESQSLASRIASLHFQYYKDEEDILKILESNKEHIQCIVSNEPIRNFDVIPYGDSQSPSLWSYADGIDTMKFLLENR